MAFQLDIKFIGECLFVPQQAPPAVLHVLLPVVPLDMTDEPFVAAMCFNPAYQQPGSAALAAGVTIVPLQQVFLELGNPQSSLVPAIPQAVMSIGSAGSVLRGVLDNDPQGLLNARVNLFSGSSGSTGAGSDWIYGDRPCASYTNSLIWTMQMEGDQLDLILFPFSGTGTSVVSLYPVGGTIRLDVYGTPASDLPPFYDPGSELPPDSGARLLQFRAYYRMFGGPLASETQVPTYCGATQAAGPYTCMLAQAG